MGLKENIKNKRLELGLTLEEVANKIGVKKPTLQRYESGVISNIPSDKIEALAEIFDISPAYLMGWIEEKKDVKSNYSPNELTKKDEKEQLLLDNFNKLNDLGKNKVINYTKDLTEVNKYINIEPSFEIDTIAAHNDYLHLDGEMENIMKDLEDMDNW